MYSSRVLGLEWVTKGDSVFSDLVLARIIEQTSKIDAARVLSEVGVELASYATIKRRLPVYARRRGGSRWPLPRTACRVGAGLTGTVRRLDVD